MLLRRVRRGLALTTLFVALACVPAAHALADDTGSVDPGPGTETTTTTLGSAPATDPAPDPATDPATDPSSPDSTTTTTTVPDPTSSTTTTTAPAESDPGAASWNRPAFHRVSSSSPIALASG